MAKISVTFSGDTFDEIVSDVAAMFNVSTRQGEPAAAPKSPGRPRKTAAPQPEILSSNSSSKPGDITINPSTGIRTVHVPAGGVPPVAAPSTVAPQPVEADTSFLGSEASSAAKVGASPAIPRVAGDAPKIEQVRDALVAMNEAANTGGIESLKAVLKHFDYRSIKEIDCVKDGANIINVCQRVMGGEALHDVLAVS
jgi:hypothetical protein